MDDNNPDTNNKMLGGRRHRRKGHKTRKEPNVLKSWRKFVRKVQHEEHLSYPKAMKRASQRKSEWQRGGATDGLDDDNNMNMSTGGRRRRRRSRKQRGGDVPDYEDQYGGDPDNDPDDDGNDDEATVGGRRRRSRRQRGGNAPSSSSAPASVAEFDGNYDKQYGSVGGSRKRRRHRR
jgi:hypothetical protein